MFEIYLSIFYYNFSLVISGTMVAAGLGTIFRLLMPMTWRAGTEQRSFGNGGENLLKEATNRGLVMIQSKTKYTRYIERMTRQRHSMFR